MENTDNVLYPESPISPQYDISGNVLIIHPDSTDLMYQETITQSVQQIQTDLSNSDPLTNDVFIRYSLACTLILCLVFLVFNHKR